MQIRLTRTCIHVYCRRVGYWGRSNQRGSRRTWYDLFVTKLHDTMQIFQCFLLSPLRLTELLNQVRFNVFELLDFVLCFRDLLLPFLLVEIIVFRDLMVNLSLVQLFESHELFLVLQTLIRWTTDAYPIYHCCIISFLFKVLFFIVDSFVVTFPLLHCHEFFCFLIIEIPLLNSPNLLDSGLQGSYNSRTSFQCQSV